MTEPVRLSAADGILTITLDRPKANAIDVATSQALHRAFQRLEQDPELRVAVLTGAGDRFFSAGWDLKAAAAGEAADADHGPGGFGGLTEFFTLDKPVVAAVNGLAVGGGFELALAADLVVAAEHAEFALPEVTLGLVADSGGVLRLPRRVPETIATEMLLTGRRMSAAEASRWGLVNQVVPGPSLLDTALALAQRICGAAPLAVAAVKEIARNTEGCSVPEAFRLMRSGALPRYRQAISSEDARQGPLAFVAKRAPRWTGR